MKNPAFVHHMFSDASLKGWGVYMGSSWLTGSWNADEQLKFSSDCQHVVHPSSVFMLDRTNINELELWPIYVGISTWYSCLRHKTLILHCDNTQVVGLLTNYVRTNTNCLRLLHDLFWVLVYNDIPLEIHHIPTEENVLADTLSRLYYPDKWVAKCDIINNSNLCCNEMFTSFLHRFGGGSRSDAELNYLGSVPSYEID